MHSPYKLNYFSRLANPTRSLRRSLRLPPQHQRHRRPIEGPSPVRTRGGGGKGDDDFFYQVGERRAVNEECGG